MSSTLWHLYLIRTASGMLYTGITTDVQRRLEQHQRGGGAKSLRGKGPLTLVFQRPAGDRSRALRWEYRVKQLSRRQKERFVALQEQALECFGLLAGEAPAPPLDGRPLASAPSTPTPGAQPAGAKTARPD
ncbi:GIY-YIG nuclease [Sodalis praecaptivus]|uniref:UPF0213 protein Sant_3441 n=1 Tax=Sodalis praecaptivus TaxID=1239307 RepID=W0I1U5_9GAMM|nr:GIY-YIG nuclease [Sodalis praecaptivus]